METYFECLPCLVRQALDAARHVTGDEAIHESVLREVLTSLADMDLHQPPPVMGGVIHRVTRRIIRNPDPYAHAKDSFNRAMQEMLPEFRSIVQSAKDPFESAVRLAIAGNVMDRAANASLDKSHVEHVVRDALSRSLPEGSVRDLRLAIENADDILYLGDNAGEIVLDGLLIEHLPREKITYVVRGSPVIDDVTRQDAETAGISNMVYVIDNGSDVPGTYLPSCSEAFRRRFDEADLVLSKGQGNYESLSHSKKNIFFLFKTKCSVISMDAGYEIGTLVVQRSRN